MTSAAQALTTDTRIPGFAKTAEPAERATPTVHDVRAWIEARRSKLVGERGYMNLSHALVAFGITTHALEGSAHPVMYTEDEDDGPRTLLLPVGIEERVLGIHLRWALGIAILSEMGEAFPKAIAYDDEDACRWDEAEQVGAMMLVSLALIDRVVPHALKAVVFGRGSLSHEANQLATREIVKSFGGDEACAKALGDDAHGTVSTAVMVRAFEGEDVTVMLGRGIIKHELEYVRHQATPKVVAADRCHDLPHVLAERVNEYWLNPKTKRSIDILAVAAECGVQVSIDDDADRRHRILFDPRRVGTALVVCNLNTSSFSDGRWSAEACTHIATMIGVGVMIRYGLITSQHLATDDIDYSLAGEIGAFVLVPKKVLLAADRVAADLSLDDDDEEGRSERFALRMRNELLRANPREGYDLSEIFHVVAFLMNKVSPYDAHGILVVTGAA